MFNLSSYESPRVIRVFISSTFLDMKEEREMLVKHTFPQLRKMAQERAVELTEVDLRWGINDEQVLRGKTLALCLTEIERSRPYFIGLLAHRYGWIPNDPYPGEAGEAYAQRIGKLRRQLKRDERLSRAVGLMEKGISATEIEIQYGVLQNADNRGKARFYFRTKSDEQLCEEAGSDACQRLETLKEAIRSRMCADHAPKFYTTVKELHDLTLKDFQKFLDEDYPLNQTPSKLHTIISAHKAFARTRMGVWKGAESMPGKLDELLEKGICSVLVTGFGGLGKTALLAHWIERRQNMFEDTVFYVFCGGGPGATSWRSLMRFLIDQVVDLFDLQDKFVKPKADVDLGPGLCEVLRLALPKVEERLIVVVDGVDQVVDAGDLRWWPEALPEGVTVVFGVRSGVVADYLLQRKFVPVEMHPLEITDRYHVITEVLGRYAKDLTTTLKREIAEDQESGNPLVLRTLLEELKACGNRDDLDQIVHGYIDTTSYADFFIKVIERIVEDYPKAKRILPLLRVAIVGLSETEIREVAGLESHLEWSEMYDALRPHLADRDGLLAFSHDFIKNAVDQFFIHSEEERKKWQRELALYFHDPKRRLEMHAIQEWQELFALLGDVCSLLDPETICNLYDYNVDQENPKFRETLMTLEKHGGDINSYLRNRNMCLATKEDIRKEDRLASIGFLLDRDDLYIELAEKMWNMIEDGNTMKELIANNLGAAYGNKGNLKKSEEFFLVSFELALKYPSKSDIAQRVANLGILNATNGKIREATILHQCSMQLLEGAGKDEENRYYSSLYNLALEYWESGMFDSALDAMEKSYAGYSQIYPMDHSCVVKTGNELGRYHKRLNRWKNLDIGKDEERFQLISLENTEDASALAEEFVEKGWISARSQGKKELAMRYLELAHTIAQKTNDETRTAESGIKLAAMQLECGLPLFASRKQLEDWLAYFRRTGWSGMVKQGRRVLLLLEDSHIENIDSLWALIQVGRAFRAGNLVELATKNFYRAKNLFQDLQRMAPGHPRLVTLAEELRLAFAQMDRPTDATEMDDMGYIRESLQMRGEDYQKEATMATRHNYAESCLHTGLLDESLELESRLLDECRVQEDRFSKIVTSKVYGNLGRIARSQKRCNDSLHFHALEVKTAASIDAEEYFDPSNGNLSMLDFAKIVSITELELFAESYWNQAITLRRMGELKEAHARAEKGLQAAHQAKNHRWIATCGAEEAFNGYMFVSGADGSLVAATIQDRLVPIEQNFVLGHWIGSAYLACVLQRAGQAQRAQDLWNITLKKARDSGFKLVEWEMDALQEQGWWKG